MRDDGRQQYSCLLGYPLGMGLGRGRSSRGFTNKIGVGLPEICVCGDDSTIAGDLLSGGAAVNAIKDQYGPMQQARRREGAPFAPWSECQDPSAPNKISAIGQG